MERCLDCNSLLAKEEKICLECGTKVGGDDSNIAAMVASLVTILFYVSIIPLVASPFINRGPSFVFCMFISCALLFVMRTAKDSTQKVRKR
jgi:hypothetical protein